MERERVKLLPYSQMKLRDMAFVSCCVCFLESHLEALLEAHAFEQGYSLALSLIGWALVRLDYN